MPDISTGGIPPVEKHVMIIWVKTLESDQTDQQFSTNCYVKTYFIK